MVIARKNGKGDWFERLWPDARIVHYTHMKPMWTGRTSNGDSRYQFLFDVWWKVHDDMQTKFADDFKKCDSTADAEEIKI